MKTNDTLRLEAAVMSKNIKKLCLQIQNADRNNSELYLLNEYLYLSTLASSTVANFREGRAKITIITEIEVQYKVINGCNIYKQLEIRR